MRPLFKAASLKAARDELSKAIDIIERIRWGGQDLGIQIGDKGGRHVGEPEYTNRHAIPNFDTA
jgi:hypothetical protein